MKTLIINFKFLIFLIVSIFALISCNNNDDQTQEIFYPRTIEPIIQSYGLFYNTENDNIPPQSILINNLNEWNNFYIDYNNYGLNYYFNNMEYGNLNSIDTNLGVDFTEENFFIDHSIVVLLDTIRPYTGYELKHSSITEYQNYIEVKGQSIQLSSGFTVTVQPFYIVIVDKIIKPIEFEIIEQ